MLFSLSVYKPSQQNSIQLHALFNPNHYYSKKSESTLRDDWSFCLTVCFSLMRQYVKPSTIALLRRKQFSRCPITQIFLLRANVVELFSDTHHGSQRFCASKSSLVWGLSMSPSFCNIRACVRSLLIMATFLQSGASFLCRNLTAYMRELRWFEIVAALQLRTSCKERRVSLHKKHNFKVKK